MPKPQESLDALDQELEHSVPHQFERMDESNSPTTKTEKSEASKPKFVISDHTVTAKQMSAKLGIMPQDESKE